MLWKTFFVPHQYRPVKSGEREFTAAVIIPSFKPSDMTLELTSNIAAWHPDYRIYVIDDCSPAEHLETRATFEKIGRVSSVTLLRTPSNKLKAGAVNFALEYIKEQANVPDVIFLTDDDIRIVPETLPAMTKALANFPEIGAVCSQSRVANKNVNFLTRLQGLEYLGFNVTRLAEEGFFMGPLVMAGMLTAFRGQALLAAGGLKEGCLIEDYDITVRLKEQGWHVAAVFDAPAWTSVPETFSQLWKQRVRWVYGGISVLSQAKYFRTVVQDVLGHSLFLSTLAVVSVSFLWPSGPVVAGNQTMADTLARLIVAISLAQLVAWYSFQLWVMRLYGEKDWKDWLIRASLLPEFLYFNFLSLVLIGSYIYFLFNQLAAKLSRAGWVALKITRWGTVIFRKLGFTETWGTRPS